MVSVSDVVPLVSVFLISCSPIPASLGELQPCINKKQNKKDNTDDIGANSIYVNYMIGLLMYILMYSPLSFWISELIFSFKIIIMKFMYRIGL